MTGVHPKGLSWWEKVRFFIRLRQRLRAGASRLQDGWFQILQTAVAAGVAWLLTFLILGRWQPEFAPIAAVISLGLAAGQRGRRGYTPERTTGGLGLGLMRTRAGEVGAELRLRSAPGEGASVEVRFKR